MHSEQAEKFLERSAHMAPDLNHRKTINVNIGKYNAVVPQGKSQFSDLELARKKAKNLKWKAVEKLDRYLEQFEFNFTRNGGKLIWAENAEDARMAILQICKAVQCRR
jgi:L-lactate dehydrogenase complex protein LldF